MRGWVGANVCIVNKKVLVKKLFADETAEKEEK